jgi:hypothetical protein
VKAEAFCRRAISSNRGWRQVPVTGVEAFDAGVLIRGVTGAGVMDIIVHGVELKTKEENENAP